MLQIIDRKEFENPQDCFKEAMVLMQDAEDPRGMSCVPVPDDRKQAYDRVRKVRSKW